MSVAVHITPPLVDGFLIRLVGLNVLDYMWSNLSTGVVLRLHAAVGLILRPVCLDGIYTYMRIHLGKELIDIVQCTYGSTGWIYLLTIEMADEESRYFCK
jgi:hypothetical protein